MEKGKAPPSSLGNRISRLLTTGATVRRVLNLARTELQYRAGSVRVTGVPPAIFVDPACLCNLRCPLCFIGRKLPGRKRGLMTMETFRSIVDQVARDALVIHLYIRGEPLLNPQVFEMIAYAKAAGLKTAMSTHFSVFQEDLADNLIDSGLDGLTLSIDGATPETYSHYRIGGDFERVMTNLGTLIARKRARKASNPEIEWQYLAFRHNIHEIAAARSRAHAMGVRFTVLQGLLGGPGYEPFTGEHDPALVDKWIAPPEALRHHLDPQLLGGPLFFDYQDEHYLNSHRCIFLWKTAYFNWDGSLSPCCFVYDAAHDYGNVHEAPLPVLRNNEHFLAARSLFLPPGSSRRSWPETICFHCHMYRTNSPLHLE